MVAVLWRVCVGALCAAGLAWAGTAAGTPAGDAPAATPPAGAWAASLRRPVQGPGVREPVVAVLALNEGTETTDFLVPHAVLRQAQVGVVQAVAPRAGRIRLMPALEVDGAQDFAGFDAQHPEGADVVVVPALHDDRDPAVRAWLQRQAGLGALVVAVCSGARVAGQAGLLDGRRFTGHWYDRSTLLARHASARYQPGLRYLADGPVVTTTGVSASVPVSLALVELLAGADRAQAAARALGVQGWGPAHRSERFGLGPSAVWTAAVNTLRFWQHETLALHVADGEDDVALALAADAWSRTYRAQAVAVTAPGAVQPVRLRSGLRLHTVPAPPGAVPRDIAPAGAAAGCVLGAQLQAIGQHYGAGTRRWVALQLEYDEAQGDCGVPPP